MYASRDLDNSLKFPQFDMHLRFSLIQEYYRYQKKILNLLFSLLFTLSEIAEFFASEFEIGLSVLVTRL